VVVLNTPADAPAVADAPESHSEPNVQPTMGFQTC
jgi:hypothetical protein